MNKNNTMPTWDEMAREALTRFYKATNFYDKSDYFFALAAIKDNHDAELNVGTRFAVDRVLARRVA